MSTSSAKLRVVSNVALLVFLVGCERSREGGPGATRSETSSHAISSARPADSSTASPDESASPSVSTPTPAPTSTSLVPSGVSEGCPEGMVLVDGLYCPDVEQDCLEHHPEVVKDRERAAKAREKGERYKSSVAERCLRYAEPSRCVAKERVPMRFCVDRYEYPNQKGELPSLLVSWMEAKKICESAGKRLCTEREFNFACEGEAMLPYTYGFVRDASKCNIDRAYRKRERKLYRYEKCMKRPACREHLAELDQRVPAGSMPDCISPFGVHDMNGNINEWVELPGKQYPDRSGLKGGWWGPVRGRCRPTVDFHKEEDYGYEEGFRCCASAAPKPG